MNMFQLLDKVMMEGLVTAETFHRARTWVQYSEGHEER